MFQKKNKTQLSAFNEYLKSHGEQQFYQYLQPTDLLNLALTSKKLYLLMNPYLSARGLDEAMNTKQTGKNKKNQSMEKEKAKKKNKDKKQKSPRNNNTTEVEVDVARVPLTKCQTTFSIENWKKIDVLPEDFNSSYLQKKIDSGATFFYMNQDTSQLVYINRSLVDPKLNYNQGGFD